MISRRRGWCENNLALTPVFIHTGTVRTQTTYNLSLYRTLPDKWAKSNMAIHETKKNPVISKHKSTFRPNYITSIPTYLIHSKLETEFSFSFFSQSTKQVSNIWILTNICFSLTFYHFFSYSRFLRSGNYTLRLLTEIT